MRRRPFSTSLSSWPRIRPAGSVKKSRSTVITCETLATESFGREAALAGMSTFPGASTSRRFDVRTRARTVRSRLRLKASLCTISTGRRNPGSEPAGSPKSAHQICPRSTTNGRAQATAAAVAGHRSRGGFLPHRTGRSVALLPSGLCAWPRSRPGRWRRAGSGTPPIACRGSQPIRTSRLESTVRLSYFSNTMVGHSGQPA